MEKSPLEKEVSFASVSSSLQQTAKKERIGKAREREGKGKGREEKKELSASKTRGRQAG